MTAASPLPLAGRAVLVTRPAHQSQGLAARLAALGAEPVLFPTISIDALPDDPRLADAVIRLERFDLVIFASANAVTHAWPAISTAGGFRPHTRVAAIGKGTADALGQHGVHDVLTSPTGTDSESLLGLEALNDVAHRRVALFSGLGGRTLLADTLRARGADVTIVPCYVRNVPDGPLDDLVHRLDTGTLDAVTVTSAEGVRNLFDRLPPGPARRLRPLPHIVNHSRVADAAREQGVTDVTVAGSGDDALARSVLHRLHPDCTARAS